MMLEVVELRDGEEWAWDEYVCHCPAASPYHLSGWKQVMERTYGYPSFYLMAKQGGRIEGVLPLFEIKSRLLGDYVTSLYRGLCTENGAAAHMLIEQAKEITIAADARYLVLRDSPQKWGSDLLSVEGHYTAIRDLPPEPESAWKDLDRETRRQVRLARKNDLRITVGHGECLEDFYRLFCRFVKDVGTPVFSKRYLQNTVEELPGLPLIFLVWSNGDVVAGHWAFSFNNVIYGAWGGCAQDYLSLGADYLTYWEHLRYGCEHECKRVDFGRCLKDTGHYVFKKRWASRFLPLYQQYFLNGLETVPDILARAQADRRYRLFARFWRRLPVPVTRWLGPQIRRHLPLA